MSRRLKTIGLFCRISPLVQGSFAKETCHFKEPTNRSHPIRKMTIKLTVETFAARVLRRIRAPMAGNSRNAALL